MRKPLNGGREDAVSEDPARTNARSSGSAIEEKGDLMTRRRNAASPPAIFDANAYAANFDAERGFEADCVVARHNFNLRHLARRRPRGVLEIGCGDDLRSRQIPGPISRPFEGRLSVTTRAARPSSRLTSKAPEAAM